MPPSSLAPAFLVGDCRAMLATLEPESVQCCVTSPPYFGLRAYGTNAQLWGGDPLCAHEWRGVVKPAANGIIHSAMQGETLNGNSGTRQPGRSEYCALCGCWRGELGSEPSVEQFISDLVDVFRAVRRVLRPDGTLWLNLGASYAGSGKGPTGHNGIGDQAQRQGFTGVSTRSTLRGGSGIPRTDKIAQAVLGSAGGVDGWKAKDLIQTPFLLAEALRQDGWWLRSAIPWLKASAMPESVTDRPSVSLEWMFLLAKSDRYYYDPEAVRSSSKYDGYLRKGASSTANVHASGDSANDRRTMTGYTLRDVLVDGRNRRNGDWYMESLDLLISGLRDYADELEAVKERKGLLLDPDGEPLGLLVNPQALAAAHFASFPEKLVEPLIKASTPEAGCCSECLAPWRRQRERTFVGSYHDHKEDGVGYGLRQSGKGPASTYDTPRTLGWQPSCDHDAPTVPSTVLDPFGGSGTVGLVARALGRRSILIDLSESYVEEIARPRVRGERLKAKRQAVGLGPLFTHTEAS